VSVVGSFNTVSAIAVGVGGENLRLYQVNTMHARSGRRRLAYAESKKVNPTSGANQHLVAPAGASFQHEAALILLHLLHLQVRLQMPR
jgi:hypothetical protein